MTTHHRWQTRVWHWQTSFLRVRTWHMTVFVISSWALFGFTVFIILFSVLLADLRFTIISLARWRVTGLLVFQRALVSISWSARGWVFSFTSLLSGMDTSLDVFIVLIIFFVYNSHASARATTVRRTTFLINRLVVIQTLSINIYSQWCSMICLNCSKVCAWILIQSILWAIRYSASFTCWLNGLLLKVFCSNISLNFSFCCFNLTLFGCQCCLQCCI